MALRDVMNTMRAQSNEGEPIPFSFRAVTLNEQLQTGGDFLDVEKAILSDEGKKIAATPSQELKAEVQRMEKRKKNPNHSENLTINIQILPGYNVRKIHPLLITRFNGYTVF